jgi:2-keto-3-deoxy-L-rhamnonate aldolase RhmA
MTTRIRALGTMISLVRSSALIAAIADAGLDFVVIDMQHSGFETALVGDMCRVANLAGIRPIVRPYSDDPGLLRQILHQGAGGLMCAGIESRSQIESVREVLDTFGSPRHGSKDRAQLVIQIETRHGVRAVGDLVAGGGVDVVEVGRSDLSRALGVPGERRHPDVLAAMDAVAADCRPHGAMVGGMCDAEDDALDLVARGVTWLMYSSDRALLEASYRRARAFIDSTTG